MRRSSGSHSSHDKIDRHLAVLQQQLARSQTSEEQLRQRQEALEQQVAELTRELAGAPRLSSDGRAPRAQQELLLDRDAQLLVQHPASSKPEQQAGSARYPPAAWVTGRAASLQQPTGDRKGSSRPARYSGVAASTAPTSVAASVDFDRPGEAFQSPVGAGQRWRSQASDELPHSGSSPLQLDDPDNLLRQIGKLRTSIQSYQTTTSSAGLRRGSTSPSSARRPAAAAAPDQPWSSIVTELQDLRESLSQLTAEKSGRLVPEATSSGSIPVQHPDAGFRLRQLRSERDDFSAEPKPAAVSDSLGQQQYKWRLVETSAGGSTPATGRHPGVALPEHRASFPSRNIDADSRRVSTGSIAPAFNSARSSAVGMPYGSVQHQRRAAQDVLNHPLLQPLMRAGQQLHNAEARGASAAMGPTSGSYSPAASASRSRPNPPRNGPLDPAVTSTPRRPTLLEPAPTLSPLVPSTARTQKLQLLRLSQEDDSLVSSVVANKQYRVAASVAIDNSTPTSKPKDTFGLTKSTSIFAMSPADMHLWQSVQQAGPPGTGSSVRPRDVHVSSAQGAPTSGRARRDIAGWDSTPEVTQAAGTAATPLRSSVIRENGGTGSAQVGPAPLPRLHKRSGSSSMSLLVDEVFSGFEQSNHHRQRSQAQETAASQQRLAAQMQHPPAAR